MGITSSTESKSRYDFLTLEKLHLVKEGKVKLEDMPEEKRVLILGMFDAAQKVWWNGLHALFPTTKGELSIAPRKEGGTDMDEDEDEDDQVFERYSDFMKKGGCKESFTALIDCLEDTQSMTKCKEHLPILKKCMDSHISYYEPILALAKATEEKAIAFGKEEIQKNHAQARGD